MDTLAFKSFQFVVAGTSYDIYDDDNESLCM